MSRKESSEHRRGREPAREFAVDERLVMPETGFEIVDGEVVQVPPSDQPHGSRHSKLSALLEAYAAEGYDAASDMLTRTSEKSDMAPDGSIYPSAPDPTTGGRQLEELAFEVVSTETLAAAGKKADRLRGRGVRRVFAIDVERRRALEWSTRTRTWEILAPDGAVLDRALVLPLPIHDLVAAAKADDAVARALIAKKNPVIVGVVAQARAEGEIRGDAKGRAEGRAEGQAEAILLVLAGRGLQVSQTDAKKIRAARDSALLGRWLTAAGTCKSTTQLLSETAPKPRSPKRRARD